MMRRPVLIALSLMAVTASAQAQQPRSVEYFIMHNDARMQMERHCSGGIVSPLVDAECINAHQAGHWMLLAAAQQRVNQGRHGLGDDESPLYYDANPWARVMVLKECVQPSSAIRPTAAACQAARISAGQ